MGFLGYDFSALIGIKLLTLTGLSKQKEDKRYRLSLLLGIILVGIAVWLGWYK